MDDELDSGLVWDKPHFYLNSQKFIPKIYDSPFFEEKVPKYFNSVKILLDGKSNSTLNWESQKNAAKKHVQEGLMIFWELDLGLFSRLNAPLTDQTQFLTLCLALEHFNSNLWPDFKNTTVGICLYRGTADFCNPFPWVAEYLQNLPIWLQNSFRNVQDFIDEINIPIKEFQEATPLLLGTTIEGQFLLKLFCRDISIEYLNLLQSRLPHDIQSYLLLDALTLSNPLHQAQILTKERFTKFHLALKGTLFPTQELAWDQSSSYGFISEEPQSIPLNKECKIGVCLPSMEMHKPSHYVGLNHALERLLTKGVPFKIIPEEFLIIEWDGLDYLIFTPAGLTPQGKRKLLGFCAAGGTIVNLQESIGSPNERVDPELSFINEL